MTVVKNTVGVTVKAWTYTMSLYGSAESSLTSYIQFIFRAGSSDENKDKFYTFDFCPNRVLKVVDMYAQARATDNNVKTTYKEAVSTVLNYLAVFAYNGAANFNRLNVNEFYKNIAQYTTDRSCRNLLLKSFSFIVSQFYNEVVDLKVENYDVTVTHNDVLTKIKKELVNHYNKKTKKQIDCVETSDEEYTEKFYQAFIDIFKFTKYIHDKIDNVEDLINKIELYKDHYEDVYRFSTDFINALICVMKCNEKNFNIVIERFADLEFKMDKTNVPMQLADKMVCKLTIDKPYSTICDWCCKGPNLLLAAKKVYPNSILYARINKEDERTRLVLQKEIPEVKFVYVPKMDEGECMKFDCIVMNPPYDRGLYVSIIAIALKYCNKLVSINPAHQFIEYKNLIQLKPIVTKNKQVLEHIKSFELLDASENNKIFIDAAIDNQLCVILYDNTNSYGLNYKDFNQIKESWRSIFYKTVYRIAKKQLHDLYSEILKFTEKTYKLPIPRVHGHVNCKDWTEVTTPVYERCISSKLTNDWHVSFETEQERKNCFDVWHNSKIHNFIHYMVKDCIFNELSVLPWLVDYTHPWTDKRLCEYFNITGYISDTEAEPGSEWETILNSVK